jgi:ABC-type branched-subunit amino acid transport system permease subunit
MPSHTRWLPFLGFLVAAATAFVLTPYQATIAVYIMTFAIVCVGLVVMTGIAGMVSVGQAAFVGVGAYVTAWLTTTYGVSPWFGLVASLLTAGVTALLIGSITVRMSGHYLALATLCFCISLYFLIGNTEALGLFNGITGIPGLSIAGWDLRGERNSYLVVHVVGAQDLEQPRRAGAALFALRLGHRGDIRRQRRALPLARLHHSRRARRAVRMAIRACPALR